LHRIRIFSTIPEKKFYWKTEIGFISEVKTIFVNDKRLENKILVEINIRTQLTDRDKVHPIVQNLKMCSNLSETVKHSYGITKMSFLLPIDRKQLVHPLPLFFLGITIADNIDVLLKNETKSMPGDNYVIYQEVRLESGGKSLYTQEGNEIVGIAGLDEGFDDPGVFIYTWSGSNLMSRVKLKDECSLNKLGIFTEDSKAFLNYDYGTDNALSMKLLSELELNERILTSIDLLVENKLNKEHFFYFDRENEHKDLNALVEHFEGKGFSVYMKEAKYGLGELDYIYEVHIL